MMNIQTNYNPDLATHKKIGPSQNVAFIHLGCEKNLVDTEHMMGLLHESGINVIKDSSKAKVVVVNTCSFIDEARQESVRTLVELAESGKQLIIAGCLAQHFKEELLVSIPEAKAIVGTGDYQHIVDVFREVQDGQTINKVSDHPTYVANEDLPRLRTTNKSVAYLKIAEGCNYRCSFCIIPALRGNQRSRSIESIVFEATHLAQDGVKELILISQISTNYGLDLYGKPSLGDLLRALGEVPIPWIRVHYAYPTGLTKDLLLAYREVENVLPYLDLPLQHSHPSVLKRMNRPWQKGINSKLISGIREHLPDAVFRTSFIVGFPGESQDHFNHLICFIEEHRFDHVGVFTYSQEAGTQSASMDNQVPHQIAQARKDQILSIQESISWEKNQFLVGKTIDVLIESLDNYTGEYIGRCARFAPEIDGEVRISGVDSVEIGSFLPVLITQATTYDLNGVPAR